MQFRILQPDVFTSYWRFVNTFCITESNYFGVQILGAKKSMLKELQSIMEIMTIGRDYKTAGRSLPPVIEKYIPIKLNPQIRKLYDQAIEYWRIQDEAGDLTFTNYMQAMHTIRQHLTGYLKAEVVKDLLEDEPNQSVMFSWYKNTAQSIAELVENCELVTGDIDVAERRIRALKGNHVSATIASLSEGIDLSTARNVVFVEEDWTPGSNYQALSRVVRERLNESNEEPVIVYYIHCERTIDEVIHRRQKQRGSTAKEVIKEALYL
jgi:SNF2 family DNA or RNA helicase